MFRNFHGWCRINNCYLVKYTWGSFFILICIVVGVGISSRCSRNIVRISSSRSCNNYTGCNMSGFLYLVSAWKYKVFSFYVSWYPFTPSLIPMPYIKSLILVPTFLGLVKDKSFILVMARHRTKTLTASPFSLGTFFNQRLLQLIITRQ